MCSVVGLVLTVTLHSNSTKPHALYARSFPWRYFASRSWYGSPLSAPGFRTRPHEGEDFSLGLIKKMEQKEGENHQGIPKTPHTSWMKGGEETPVSEEGNKTRTKTTCINETVIMRVKQTNKQHKSMSPF